MGMKIVSAPANAPVTLVEAKAHLRVDFTDDDNLINGLIAAATNHAQKFLGRFLVAQTWDYSLDAFPTKDYIEIPMPPLIEVLSVSYTDESGNEQTLSEDRYAVDEASEPGRLYLPSGVSWPATVSELNSLRIRFRAGYITPDSPPEDDVPWDLKAAILLMVGSLYENRESEVVGAPPFMLPWGAEQLMRQHRINLSLA